jgi:rfaE bifunctional protein nucleotidyltransferase chain/domain
MSHKVFTFDALHPVTQRIRLGGGLIIHCHGCFDLLHVGHVRHLNEARTFGDFLVDPVTPDEYIGKGDGRPVIKAHERAEMLAALECVGAVVVNTHQTAIEAIAKVKPHVFVKGGEFRTNKTEALLHETEVVTCYGGVVRYTAPSDKSTTAILRQIRSM